MAKEGMYNMQMDQKARKKRILGLLLEGVHLLEVEGGEEGDLPKNLKTLSS